MKMATRQHNPTIQTNALLYKKLTDLKTANMFNLLKFQSSYQHFQTDIRQNIHLNLHQSLYQNSNGPNLTQNINFNPNLTQFPAVTSNIPIHRCHTQNLKHQCSDCGKFFATPNYLETHRRLHTGERPFQCHICGRKFAQRPGFTYTKNEKTWETGDLKRVETDLEVISNIVEVQPVNLKKKSKKKNYFYFLFHHMRSAHTGEKRYECKICNKKFIQLGTIKRHIETHSTSNPDDHVARLNCTSDSELLKTNEEQLKKAKSASKNMKQRLDTQKLQSESHQHLPIFKTPNFRLDARMKLEKTVILQAETLQIETSNCKEKVKHSDSLEIVSSARISDPYYFSSVNHSSPSHANEPSTSPTEITAQKENKQKRKN